MERAWAEELVFLCDVKIFSFVVAKSAPRMKGSDSQDPKRFGRGKRNP